MKPVDADFGLVALNALRAGAKRAKAEIDAIGGMGQFCKPGEYKAPLRQEQLPPPTLTAREYLALYGRHIRR